MIEKLEYNQENADLKIKMSDDLFIKFNEIEKIKK